MLRKNYKRSGSQEGMRFASKRGQVAVFVILALVIVAVVLVIAFYPKIKLPGGAGATPDPQQYLTTCLEPFVHSSLERLSRQGGMQEPLGFIVHNDTKIPYFCYTSEYYKPCMVQQPNVVGLFSRELGQAVVNEARTCVQNFKEEYEGQGYTISTSTVALNVSFAPKQVNVQLLAPMTITKEFSKTYTSTDLSFESSMYDLLALAENIVSFESTYGDSETTLYLRYYPNIRIDKLRLGEGSKIYTISDVITGEHFTFASRGLAWPPGYAL